jgi:hypothetical protein
LLYLIGTPESAKADQVTFDGQKVSGSKLASPTPKNGAYEIADVLMWAMPSSSGQKRSLPGFQDYNRFKGVVSNIRRSTYGRETFEGQVVLLAYGKNAMVENIEDNYSWRVGISGPQVGATELAFYSGAISGDLGPNYLRKHGIELITLSCFSTGDTSTNASALYLALVPGKAPTLLSYDINTGSSGETVTYKVHYYSVNWSDVPGATERNYKGEVQDFGVCPYKNLN